MNLTCAKNTTGHRRPVNVERVHGISQFCCATQFCQRDIESPIFIINLSTQFLRICALPSEKGALESREVTRHASQCHVRVCADSQRTSKLHLGGQRPCKQGNIILRGQGNLASKVILFTRYPGVQEVTLRRAQEAQSGRHFVALQLTYF